MTMGDSEAEIIQLDVGGKRYAAASETLERCESSMLASLISKWKERKHDIHQPLFIDHDGLLFEYVLDYLQTSKVFLPRSVSRSALEKEFEYYGISADMTNVHDLYGFEHLRMMKEEIGVQEGHLDMLKREALAIQLSIYSELEYLKHLSYKTESVTVSVPKEYVNYNKKLFKECLAVRGLIYVRGACNDVSFDIARRQEIEEDQLVNCDSEYDADFS